MAESSREPGGGEVEGPFRGVHDIAFVLRGPEEGPEEEIRNLPFHAGKQHERPFLWPRTRQSGPALERTKDAAVRSSVEEGLFGVFALAKIVEVKVLRVAAPDGRVDAAVSWVGPAG